LFEELGLEVGRGEALLVTGENGSGKSSLLRLAAGLLQPQGGCVECVYASLADDNLALDRELPLCKALAFWSDDVEDPSLALGLDRLLKVPVRLLSAGQRKRATLARVAGSKAPLWLLDEPLNGLDGDSLDRVHALIDAHRRSGGAVVAASHSPMPGEWRQLELGR
jgi:heme exporter protein A